MTARMVLRLSVIILRSRHSIRLAAEAIVFARCLDANRFPLRWKPLWTVASQGSLQACWAAGRGDAAPHGGRRAWSRSHGSVRHDGRLAHNHCAVALL